MVKKSDKRIINGESIDLIELFNTFRLNRNRIVISSMVFVVFGLVIAFTSPDEYSTSTTLIPESKSGSGDLGGSIGGLASLAGFSLNNIKGAEGINPALYQSVANSTPFLAELIEQRYYFLEESDTLSLREYYTNHYKTDLIGKIIAVPKSLMRWLRGGQNKSNSSRGEYEGLVSLTEFEKAIIEDLRLRVNVSMDWEINVVTINVKMQDPVVAAKMALFTQSYITNYVTDYAVSKSTLQLRSIEQQFLSRKQEFEQAQLRLANFRDENQNVTTARARSKEESLVSQYNLAFNVYNQLAQQREAIKLKIQDDTPVFSILEPIKVPNLPASPNKKLIVVVALFIGILFSSIYFLAFRVVQEAIISRRSN